MVSYSEPQELKTTVTNLRTRIMHSREDYKEMVSELYSVQPPFVRGRSRTEENFSDELNQYLEMIGHCLIIGDSDILYRFGISPMEQDPQILVGHDNLDMYINAFLDRFNSSTSDGERFYLAMLIRSIKEINGEFLSTSMVSVD